MGSEPKNDANEDMSYCLLGIFGVNISLIYGEGARAFVRLQKEIMKREVDLSIFAWPSSAIRDRPGLPMYIPLLAPYPAVFKTCGGRNYGPNLGCGPYTLTNKGLRMENLPVVNANLVGAIFSSAGIEVSKSSFASEEAQLLALLCTYAIGSDVPANCLNDAATSFGVALKKDIKGIYCRSRKPESLLRVYPDLIHTSMGRTCHLDIWYDSSWYDATRKYVQRSRQQCVIRALAHHLGSFSISETCVKDTWQWNGKLHFYLNQLGAPNSNYGDIEPPSRPRGFLFTDNGTGERFAVIIGRRRSQMWVEIVDYGDLQNLVAEHTAEEESAYIKSQWGAIYPSGAPDRASKLLVWGQRGVCLHSSWVGRRHNGFLSRY